MTKLTSSFNDYPMKSSMRSVQPPQPQKEVFPPSHSPMGITAACFPFLVNVYSGRHGGSVISDVQ